MMREFGVIADVLWGKKMPTPKTPKRRVLAMKALHGLETAIFMERERKNKAGSSKSPSQRTYTGYQILYLDTKKYPAVGGKRELFSNGVNGNGKGWNIPQKHFRSRALGFSWSWSYRLSASG